MEIFHAHGQEDPILSRYQFSPTSSRNFSAISVKIPASYFVGLDKLILKFVQRNIIILITNIVLKSDPTQYYKAIIPIKINKLLKKVGGLTLLTSRLTI